MGQGFPSLRTDVPTDHVHPALVLRPGTNYQENHSEEYVLMRDEIVEFLKTFVPQ